LRSAVENHPFFVALSATHLEILTGCARQARFPRHTLILHQGDAADRFFLIEEGCVALEADRHGQGTLRIQTLGAGDALGWSWLFPPHFCHFSARTVEPTDAIIFDAIQLRERFLQFPGLGHVFVQRMAQVVVQRLEATQTQLVEISQIALRAQLQALQLTMSVDSASL
jgi:CRP/FNR family cyclic AMP-dependent transcriptional regulator